MTEETDRERLIRVSGKALSSVAAASAALDVPYVAIIRDGDRYHVYCSDEADIRPLFEAALEAIEDVPEGATLN